jgi:hypothetical protein
MVLVGVLALVAWTSSSCGEPDETTQNAAIRQALRHDRAFALLQKIGSIEERVPQARSMFGREEGPNGFVAGGQQASLADVDAQLRAWGWARRSADCGRDPQGGQAFDAFWSKGLPDREAFFGLDQHGQQVHAELYTLPVHANPAAYPNPDGLHSTISACIATLA